MKDVHPQIRVTIQGRIETKSAFSRPHRPLRPAPDAKDAMDAKSRHFSCMSIPNKEQCEMSDERILLATCPFCRQAGAGGAILLNTESVRSLNDHPHPPDLSDEFAFRFLVRQEGQESGPCPHLIECRAYIESENRGQLRMQNPGWAMICGWLHPAVPEIDPEFTARDFLYDMTGGVVRKNFLPSQPYGFARMDRHWTDSSKVSAPLIKIEGKATFAKYILSFFKELFEKSEEEARYWEERNRRRNPAAAPRSPAENHPSLSVGGMETPRSLGEADLELTEDEREMQAAFRAAELRTSRRK